MTRDELYQRVYHHLAGRLTCRQMTDAVTDYLEGTMGVTGWACIQMHLGLCPGCRAYLRQVKSTVGIMNYLPTVPPPPDVRKDLLQRFRCWKAGYPSPRGGRV